MAEVNKLAKIGMLPTPQVGTGSLTPPDDHTAPSWAHLGTDTRAVREAKKHFARIARKSIGNLKDRIAWEAVQKADVFSLEVDGRRLQMKFGERGEVIGSEEVSDETSGAA